MCPPDAMPADNSRQLQRRGFDRALPDATTEMVSPAYHLRWKFFSSHCAGRHQPRLLAGQIDTGLLPVAELGGILRNAVDAQSIAKRVVERVAGHRNSIVNIHHAMAFVALVEVPVKVRAAAAHDVHILRNALLQPGH